ncbi:MAG: S9 family peptidase [Vicinamibacteria bacterium]|nr:S9 family peptidase [Vicinamibacteria bacterium]
MFLTLATLLALAAPDFTAKDLHALKRLADPQLSPDGKWVLYQQTSIDLGKGRNTDLYLVAAAGGAPRAITSSPKTDAQGRFSQDGSRVAFLSTRDGSSQVYLLDLNGGEARQVTHLSQGVNNFRWATADKLVVIADVHPDCAGAGFDDCTKKKVSEKNESIRVYDKLFVRHWDTWEDGLRSHVLWVDVKTGEATDLTPGDKDVPPYPGPDDFDVSPDGAEVAFGRNDDKDESASTNADLFLTPTSGGSAKKFGAANGYDGLPRYSPDGSMIAYHAQMKAGFEADRWRLMVYDRKTGTTRNLSEPFDRNVDEIAWSPDSKTIYFTAGDGPMNPLFAIPSSGGAPRKVADGHLTQLSISKDGAKAIMALDSLQKPADVVSVDLASGKISRLTSVNDAALAPFALRPSESITYAGALGKTVQAWITKPANFDPAKKYPLLVMPHGGPQGVWGDSWSYRWNPQVFAGAGFVVLTPNPRGSTGFGQAFTDDVTRDWGGRAYEDIMKGTEFAAALPYVDKEKVVAAGASYGGYMVNWMCTQTKRFKAFVSHDGVYDLTSMAGSTEEQWFSDWEFGGPPWGKDQTQYQKFSPSRFINQCTTPMLIIHNDRDYRLPIEQGLQIFTALQRQGVPSRLVMFPEENHWVLKAENSVLWYDEVLGWLKKWVN